MGFVTRRENDPTGALPAADQDTPVPQDSPPSNDPGASPARSRNASADPADSGDALADLAALAASIQATRAAMAPADGVPVTPEPADRATAPGRPVPGQATPDDEYYGWRQPSGAPDPYVSDAPHPAVADAFDGSDASDGDGGHFPLWPTPAAEPAPGPGLGVLTVPASRRRVVASRARSRPPKKPRHPLRVFPLLLLLAAATTVFAWVSAEPFWLSVGGGHAGTVKVTRCVGEGLTRRCVGDFTPAAAHDAAAPLTGVPVTGAAEPQRQQGTELAARMVK